jgi:hypothetical protein
MHYVELFFAGGVGSENGRLRLILGLLMIKINKFDLRQEKAITLHYLNVTENRIFAEVC